MKSDLESRFVELARSSGDHTQLLELLCLLSKLENPAVSIEALKARLDTLCLQAEVRLDDAISSDERAWQLCRFLALEQNYRGNTDDYYSPANSSLDELLRSGRGIPISLAFLYIHIAKSKCWLARGVSFPGHFLVAVYQGSPGALQGGDSDQQYSLLDPFRGKLMNKTDCEDMLRAQYGDSAQLQERFFSSADNTVIIRRMLRNLKHCYLRKKQYSDALRMVNLLLAVYPSDTSELHDRAAILEHMQCYSAAAADLQTISQQRPDHPRLSQIKTSISRLERLSPATVH
ncbi:MAG: transglutaminase-like domain-containing protein [Pseudomonadota bacterium]